MSLIDRLNSPGDPDSVFARALSLRERRPVDREDEGLDTESAPTPLVPASEVDAGAAVRALLKELQVQREYGITTPSHLFSLLHRHLQVERGALLVPAFEGEHLPVATAGLDRTSSFRLRATDEELHGLLGGPRVVLLAGSDREIFAGRLSRSDYRNSPRLALFPFFHLKRLLATLIVFDSPILDLDPAVLDVILGALSENAGRMLFDGRQKPLGHRSRAVVLGLEQLPDTLTRLQLRGEHQGREIEQLELDLASIVGVVEEAHPHLDRERLIEDVLDTTALLVSESHDVIHRGETRVSLVGLTNPNLDPALLVHLVGSTLAQLFGVGSRHTLTFEQPPVDVTEREA